MTFSHQRLLGLLLLAAALLAAGCSSAPQGTQPWSRPASWENQIPGMSSAPGMGR
jgi:hypothetical protein